MIYAIEPARRFVVAALIAVGLFALVYVFGVLLAR